MKSLRMRWTAAAATAALCLASVATAGAASGKPARPWQDRFVWLFGMNLLRDADWAEMTNLVCAAAAAGYNGAVLSAGLDTMSRKPPEFAERLRRLDRLCKAQGLELIPSLFSVGYAGGLLAHNPHLAEGLPVRDAPFAVSRGWARFLPDPAVRIRDGGFEEAKGGRFPAFAFHDRPGTVSFVDERVRHGGRRALRMENFSADPHGHGRVMQEVALRPWRCYRMSVWVKTENLQPASAFRMLVLAGKRNLAPRSFNLPSTGDWRRLSMIFNSLDYSKARVYAGVWGGRSGRFWIDDWRLEEIGPVNVLRRPGTPVTVRSAATGRLYEEGRDYAPLADPKFNLYRPDHEPARLRLLPGGRIREGERLLVSWYHPMIINRSQITACMAEPEIYRIWDREAAALAKVVRPKAFLLSMDEIRMGGSCARCAGRDMGELLGECVARQRGILRRRFPGARLYVWSDMFDPNHNARGDYYLVRGSFAGSWKHLPKDIVVAVWGGAPRKASLKFFADRGFQTLVACYYDAADLGETRGWAAAARSLPGVRGFMYTTWRRKYGLLRPFLEAVSAP